MFDCEIGVNCLQNLSLIRFRSFPLSIYCVSSPVVTVVIPFCLLAIFLLHSFHIHLCVRTIYITSTSNAPTHSTIFEQFHFHRERNALLHKTTTLQSYYYDYFVLFQTEKNMNDVYWNGKNSLPLLTAVLFSSRKYVECTKQNQTN